jgi:hypothetical protein
MIRKDKDKDFYIGMISNDLSNELKKAQNKLEILFSKILFYRN